MTYVEKDVKKVKHFYGNNPMKVERERKRWINKNSKLWSDHIRPGETVFYTNRSSRVYDSEYLLRRSEVENWINIFDGDYNKVWKVVKKELKRRIIQSQTNQWIRAKEGVVLKKYKTNWWIDRISHEIEDPMMYQIKRIRIGNSKLNKHMKKGPLRKCMNCDMGVEETNDHFLLECPRFNDDRNTLKINTENELNKLNLEFNVKNLIGMDMKIMASKKRSAIYKKEILKILCEVCRYLKNQKYKKI